MEQQPGSGVSGVVSGHDVAVGSPDWLAELSVVRRPNALKACCRQQCLRTQPGPDDTRSMRCLNRPHLVQVGSLPRLPAGGQQGSTTVAVSIDGHMAAAIQIADELRADSRAAVQQLRAMGIRPVLLSGERGKWPLSDPASLRCGDPRIACPVLGRFWLGRACCSCSRLVALVLRRP